MAMSKTIILISQRSNFNNSCHVTSLNREYFPKCGKNTWYYRVIMGGKCFFCTPAAPLLSGSVEIAMYYSEEVIFWFQQNCWVLDMPSSHLATSHCIRRMLLGTLNQVPSPAAVAGGGSRGAQEDGCFPTAGCSFSSECVTGFGLYTYFTALSSFYRRLFFFCYVYLAFFLEMVNFQHIFKRFVSWHFEEICLQCIL